MTILWKIPFLFFFLIETVYQCTLRVTSDPLCPPDEVDYQLFDFYEETKVKFADLSETMLWEYIDSGEPMWVKTFTSSLYIAALLVFAVMEVIERAVSLFGL